MRVKNKLSLTRLCSLITLFIVGMVVTAGLVLSQSPYWVYTFPAYMVLTVGVTVILVKFIQPGWAKWCTGLLSLLSFWGMGHVDEILGAREHQMLCGKEAGVKILKKAQLPTEFYNSEGAPKFLMWNGSVDPKKLSGFISIEWTSKQEPSAKYLRIDRDEYKIIDTKTGTLLGEAVDFRKWPSSFIPSIGHYSADRCKFADGSTYAVSQSELEKRILFNN